MDDGSNTQSTALGDELELRLATVRRRTVRALHHLIEALVAGNTERFVELLGAAGSELDKAEAEILRAPLA